MRFKPPSLAITYDYDKTHKLTNFAWSMWTQLWNDPQHLMQSLHADHTFVIESIILGHLLIEGGVEDEIQKPV